MAKEDIVLGPIIGGVNHETAKIWFYGLFDDEGIKKPWCHVFNEEKTQKIQGSPFGFDEVSEPPHEHNGILHKAFVAEIRFPAEGEKFYFEIAYDNADTVTRQLPNSVKRGPDKGDANFSFGLISCHKAYKSTSRNKKITTTMWDLLYEKMVEENSCFLIQAGDQLYCDNNDNHAWKKSVEVVEQNNHQKMLDFYRDVYLDSWDFPEIRKVVETFPQYMIWDDHEITNGWGSKKVHSEKYKAIFKAARQAYVEFQHSHNPSSLTQGELYYAFHYGNAAFLVMDLRGHRDITQAGDSDKSPLVGQEQWGKIQEWFQSPKVKESKALFVVTSVPVIHLSRRFGSLGWLKSDIADQWSTTQNKHERRKLLKLLYDWSGDQNKPVMILGGDVHVGTEICIVEKENKKRTICQITSSPITNKPAWLLDFFMAIISKRFSFHLDAEHLQNVKGTVLRRHRRRNFAIINVKYENNAPKIELHMYRKGKAKPKVREFRFGKDSECYRKYCK